MGFWFFMFVMDLLVPFTMIGFGRYFLKNAPKEINMLFGYRTAMSMKNRETWEFAHRYCGRLWYISGLIMLPVSVLAMIFAFGKSEDYIGIVGAIVCMLQLVPLAGTIIPTEKALKKYFDEDGNRL